MPLTLPRLRGHSGRDPLIPAYGITGLVLSAALIAYGMHLRMGPETLMVYVLLLWGGVGYLITGRYAQQSMPEAQPGRTLTVTSTESGNIPRGEMLARLDAQPEEHGEMDTDPGKRGARKRGEPS